MSDDTNTVDVELEEANDHDESNAETQDTKDSSSDGEQEEKPLSIEDDKSAKKTNYKAIQEEVYTRRAMEKDTLEEQVEYIESLEDNPSTRWLADKVRDNLGLKESKPKSASEEVEQVIAKRQFENDKEELYALPTKVRNEAVKRYKELTELGANPNKALAKVLKEATQSLRGADANKQVTRDHMQIPRSGRSPSDKTTYTMEQLAKMNQAEYNRICDLEEKGQVTIVA